MKTGDMIVNVACTIIVAAMGILAFWSENSGKDIGNVQHGIDISPKTVITAKEKERTFNNRLHQRFLY